jgi:hypothetical protein
VSRGYEIADAFCVRGVLEAMGGVHQNFMPQEPLKHCDVVGDRRSGGARQALDDLEQGWMRLQVGAAAPDAGPPRYDLLKKNAT